MEFLRKILGLLAKNLDSFFRAAFYASRETIWGKTFLILRSFFLIFELLAASVRVFGRKNLREIRNYYQGVQEILGKKLHVFRKIKFFFKLLGFFAKRFWKLEENFQQRCLNFFRRTQGNCLWGKNFRATYFLTNVIGLFAEKFCTWRKS